MSRGLRITLVLLVGTLALLAGLYAGRQHQAPAGDPAALQTLLGRELPTLDGRTQRLADWRGEVLVVNFWATWCPPCRKEIPDFAAISQKYAGQGVRFVGLSVDEPDKVRAFRDELAVPYPLLIADYAALTDSTRLGNPSRALPFTLILDRNGHIVLNHAGGLNAADLEGTIAPLLAR